MMEYLHQSQIWNGRTMPGVRCYCSEKLDGHRAFWDGGISRGVPKSQVPWANTYKDARYVVAPVATGLWSRYGHCIQAPSWWLDTLPEGVCLDGELWSGRGTRQALSSVVKRSDPGCGSDWSNVKYVCWDTVGLGSFLIDRVITRPGYYGLRIGPRCRDWAESRGGKLGASLPHERSWDLIPTSGVVQRTERRLVTGVKDVASMAAEVVSGLGEGLILRWGADTWACTRSRYSLKVKPRSDAEALVVGVTDGIGRHLGRVGALVVSWEGVTFSLGTGLTDSDRDLGASFWIGQTVTFGYRGITRDGIPVEASYIRVRSPGWD